MTKPLLPYRNTVAELNASKYRLQRLKERKELLRHKYCDPKSTTYDKEVSFGGGDGHSGQERYILSITTPNEATGMSLEEEMSNLSQAIEELSNDLKMLDTIYQEANDIEKDILKEMGKGINVTKAVEKVAEKRYMSESTVWRRKRKGKNGNKRTV